MTEKIRKVIQVLKEREEVYSQLWYEFPRDDEQRAYNIGVETGLRNAINQLEKLL